LGTIYLEDIRTVEPTNEKPSQNFVFSLKGQDNSRTWYLSAASQEEMNSWMDIIKRCLNHSNTPQHNVIFLKNFSFFFFFSFFQIIFFTIIVYSSKLCNSRMF